jgi:hypothetical protein
VPGAQHDPRASKYFPKEPTEEELLAAGLDRQVKGHPLIEERKDRADVLLQRYSQRPSSKISNDPEPAAAAHFAASSSPPSADAVAPLPRRANKRALERRFSGSAVNTRVVLPVCASA